MAITVVQTASAFNGYGSGPTTLSFVTTPAVGNAVIVIVNLALTFTSYTVSGIVDNQSGNTFSKVVQQFDGSGTYQNDNEQWWCPVLSTASGTYTITMSQAGLANITISMSEVSGLSGTVDQIAGGADPDAQVEAGSVTAGGANAQASELVIVSIGIGNLGVSGALTDPPTGEAYSSLFINNGSGGENSEGAYLITSGVITPTAAWTWNTGRNYSATLAAYKGVAPPTGVPTWLWT